VPNNSHINSSIDEESLEFDGDLRCLNGTPFTGVGIDHYRSGSIRAITNYKDGLEHGLIQEWAEDGNLAGECHARRGMKHGIERKWYPSGKIRSESDFEWGIELYLIEYDDNGNVVRKREIDKDDPNSNYKILLKFRDAYSGDND